MIDWFPETASKAYIDTVKSFNLQQDSGSCVLITTLAAGWNSQLIVETWSTGGAITTSLGLSVARRHTGGRHVCVVSDENSSAEYLKAMNRVETLPEVLVGKAEEVMEGLSDIDFLIVDREEQNFNHVLKLANLSFKGSVLVCKNANSSNNSGIRWNSLIDNEKWRVVKSTFLPVGTGLDIAHVTDAIRGRDQKRRWIVHVDHRSGDLFAIRK